MKLLLSTFVAALLTLETSAKLRSFELGQDGRSLKQDGRSLQATPMSVGVCSEFAVLAGSTATCAGAQACGIMNGKLGVSPGTAYTGNFQGNLVTTASSDSCATAGLNAWNVGKAKGGTVNMVAEMGGVTFPPGVHTHGSAINIALANPVVTLDGQDNPNAEFIFVAGSTLTTCANSKIVLINGAQAENVYWVLGTALTMGANSIMVGNVLAGSAITIGTNGKICGRAIAQTAVTCETACTVKVGISDGDSDCVAAAGTTLVTDDSTDDSTNYCAAGCTPPPADPGPIVADVAGGPLPADLSGQILGPGEYTTTAATTLTGNLYLDNSAGNTGIWVIHVGAAFATAAGSQMFWTNSAGSGTVTWIVNGAISTGANSLAIGTMIATGAISVGANARTGALEATGAIALGAGAFALSTFTNAATTLGAGANTAAGAAAAASTGTLRADLGGLTLRPGTYDVAAAATLTGVLTLNAEAADGAVSSSPHTWTINIGAAFSTAASSEIRMINCANDPCTETVIFNIIGAVTTGANSVGIGILDAQGAITTGASSTCGSLYAVGAVTLGAGSVCSGAVTAIGAITMGANSQALYATTNAATTTGAGASFTGVAPNSSPVGGGTLDAALGGVTLTSAGTYTAAAAVGLTGTFTLQGAGHYVLIITGAFTTAAASQVIVAAGTTVSWDVKGAISTGAGSTVKGSMVAVGAITLGAGAHSDAIESSGGAITLGAGAISHGHLAAAGAITLGANAHGWSAATAVTYGAGASMQMNI
jgi:hypothetical protein